MRLANLNPWRNKTETFKFPENFLWGASMSAYQVEGGDCNNDWYKFEIERGLEEAKQIGVATDHYHRYKEDFDLATEIGLKTIRLSAEWSRIEPEKGKFDEGAIKHYQEVLSYLKSKGFIVILTLHHFTNPIWFAERGGWTAATACEDFLEYVKYTVPKLNENVNYWITFNESGISVIHGYLAGDWPPGEMSFTKFYRAGHNQADAHIQTYKFIKSVYPSAIVGVINNCGFSPSNWLGKTIKWPIDYVRNFYYLDFLNKNYDFIGVNYYFPGYFPGLFGGRDVERSDMDWPIYPKGLYDAIMRLSDRYDVPIIVTENGLADAKDEKRAQFIYAHLKMVERAIRHKADVFGYLHWSLTDNLEVGIGFEPRFGLIGIDYKTLTRQIRPSAKYYGKIISRGRLFPPTR
jgi:beta-glucosidase